MVYLKNKISTYKNLCTKAYLFFKSIFLINLKHKFFRYLYYFLKIKKDVIKGRKI